MLGVYGETVSGKLSYAGWSGYFRVAESRLECVNGILCLIFNAGKFIINFCIRATKETALLIFLMQTRRAIYMNYKNPLSPPEIPENKEPPKTQTPPHSLLQIALSVPGSDSYVHTYSPPRVCTPLADAFDAPAGVFPYRYICTMPKKACV